MYKSMILPKEYEEPEPKPEWIEHLWGDLKRAVHRKCSHNDLTGSEYFFNKSTKKKALKALTISVFVLDFSFSHYSYYHCR